MKIVCLGDSITHGYGVPSKKNWVTLTKKETGYDIINAGISGDTTAGMLARLDRDVFLQKPDVLMILGGVNDLISGNLAGAIQTNLNAMVHQASARGIRVMMGSILPMYPDQMPQNWKPLQTFWAKQEEFAHFLAWFPVYTKSFSVGYVDFNSRFKEAADPEPSALFLDGLHPNIEGHRLMKDAFLEVLNQA